MTRTIFLSAHPWPLGCTAGAYHARQLDWQPKWMFEGPKPTGAFLKLAQVKADSIPWGWLTRRLLGPRITPVFLGSCSLSLAG